MSMSISESAQRLSALGDELGENVMISLGTIDEHLRQGLNAAQQADAETSVVKDEIGEIREQSTAIEPHLKAIRGHGQELGVLASSSPEALTAIHGLFGVIRAVYDNSRPYAEGAAGAAETIGNESRHIIGDVPRANEYYRALSEANQVLQGISGFLGSPARAELHNLTFAVPAAMREQFAKVQEGANAIRAGAEMIAGGLAAVKDAEDKLALSVGQLEHFAQQALPEILKITRSSNENATLAVDQALQALRAYIQTLFY